MSDNTKRLMHVIQFTVVVLNLTLVLMKLKKEASK